MTGPAPALVCAASPATPAIAAHAINRQTALSFTLSLVPEKWSERSR
jgi:hypothetical protein